MQIVRTATGILESHRQTITIKRTQPINTRRSRVNGKNKIQPINTYPLLLVHYSAGIIGWPEEEIKATDIKTKKLIAIDGGFQLKSSPPRLYAEVHEYLRNMATTDHMLSEYLRQQKPEKEEEQSWNDCVVVHQQTEEVAGIEILSPTHVYR